MGGRRKDCVGELNFGEWAQQSPGFQPGESRNCLAALQPLTRGGLRCPQYLVGH